jgi:plastocyanin
MRTPWGAACGVLAAVMAFAFSDPCSAALVVAVTDARGQPIPDAVVVATPANPAPSAPGDAPVVMDQINKAFVPLVLVVQTGSAVIFPNGDAIAHQVYSFSQARRFELGLYRGHPHPPVVFDRPGLVVLGCNIHDSMVGYIYVTDSPYFGKSDAQGVWRLTTAAPGRYRLTVWSPRLARAEQPLAQSIELTATQSLHVDVRLKQTLRPASGPSRDPQAKDY